MSNGGGEQARQASRLGLGALENRLQYSLCLARTCSAKETFSENLYDYQSQQ